VKDENSSACVTVNCKVWNSDSAIIARSSEYVYKASLYPIPNPVYKSRIPSSLDSIIRQRHLKYKITAFNP
jgi:hypothetical protein